MYADEQELARRTLSDALAALLEVTDVGATWEAGALVVHVEGADQAGFSRYIDAFTRRGWGFHARINHNYTTRNITFDHPSTLTQIRRNF